MINKFRGDYNFLSNFYSVPITWEGITYPSTEAAFQAAKTLDMNDRARFSFMYPAEAKKAGYSVKLREDWDQIKYKIMYDICKIKFSKYPTLKGRLLETGNEYLEECNTCNDRTWGTVDGIGMNCLGKILMRIRDELRNEGLLFQFFNGECLSSEQVMEYQQDFIDAGENPPTYLTNVSAREWLYRIGELHKQETLYVMAMVFNGKVVGTADLRMCLDAERTHIDGNVGYAIAPSYRNQKFGSIILEEFGKRCGNIYNGDLIVAINVDNKKSIKVAENVGYTLIDCVDGRNIYVKRSEA